uniref:Ig-like domain-containing protein n=1 Tax=Trichuris muris TaxID=70415 RepID=A0A5S6QZ19_TRIMR
MLLFPLLCLLDTVRPAWPADDCPSPCRCEMRHWERFQELLKTVDCFDSQLTTFPENLPTDTQVLVLRQNHIRLLPSRELWLPDLVHLDLSHNRISSLTSEDFREYVFDGVYNLRILDLSFNHLRRLRNSDFRGLFNLEELNLGDNRISSIGDNAFHGLLKLETLRLTGNRLAFVQPGWFASLKTLTSLLLNRNQLTVLTSDNFHWLNELLTLDLSRNKIFRIHETAFIGVGKLDSLRLSSNVLTVVPRQALQTVQSLRSLYLSQNPIYKIRTDDFADLPHLRDVKLSGMQRLRLVERAAFRSLPELLVAELHDNPYLGYVDRLSFVNTPLVSHLFLHNNNLTTVEQEVIDSLDSLQEVSLYGNPLHCDCNIRWMIASISGSDNGPRSRIVYHEAERMLCDSPPEHKYKLFSSLNASSMPTNCPPRILYTFTPNETRKPGDMQVYDCRAVGIPQPKVRWTTPDGQTIDPTIYHPRRSVLNEHTLVLNHLTADDQGTYVCTAENAEGRSQRATTLNVTEMQVHLFPVHVSATSVTVTWNGTDSQGGGTVFQIFYRPSELSSRHQYAGTVTPVMRTYTIQNLRPNSDYDICIAMEDGDDVIVHLSCKRLTTLKLDPATAQRQQLLRSSGSSSTVGAVLGIVACVFIVLCVTVVALLRVRIERRRAGGKFSRLSDFVAQLESGVVVASLDQLAELKARGYSIV